MSHYRTVLIPDNILVKRTLSGKNLGPSNGIDENRP